MERVRNNPCTGGTEETLPVQFDHSVWDKYASVAMRMSNLLTKIYLQGTALVQLGWDRIIKFTLLPNRGFQKLPKVGIIGIFLLDKFENKL